MLRAIVLSLALLIGIGTLIPMATEFAEAGSQKKKTYKKPKVKKYSKRWWRAYNQRKSVRQKRAARVRQAKVRRARQAKVRRARQSKARRANVANERRTVTRNRASEPARSNENAVSPPKAAVSKTTRTNATVNYSTPAVLPSGNPAPKTWKSEGLAQGELQFRVTDNSGSPVGAASISIVGPAIEDAPVLSNRVKSVGGVSTTALRRTVIDQMIKENGWVVNDFQKEIGGKNVYVVQAQAPGANNQVENRMFYFTEVEGKIYSVATKAPDNGSVRLEEESEKVLNSLQPKYTSVAPQVASNRTASNLVANEE
jgi:hypothetical protein